MGMIKRAQLMGEGWSSDEARAIEYAWSVVPEPIEVVIADSYIYVDGVPRPDLKIIFGDDIASLEYGTPVVVKRPVAYGVYVFDEFYNHQSIEEHRETVAQQKLAEIKQAKKDQFYAQQADASDANADLGELADGINAARIEAEKREAKAANRAEIKVKEDIERQRVAHEAAEVFRQMARGIA